MVRLTWDWGWLGPSMYFDSTFLPLSITSSVTVLLPSWFVIIVFFYTTVLPLLHQHKSTLFL
jgi:hypothetical protein